MVQHDITGNSRGSCMVVCVCVYMWVIGMVHWDGRKGL